MKSGKGEVYKRESIEGKRVGEGEEMIAEGKSGTNSNG